MDQQKFIIEADVKGTPGILTVETENKDLSQIITQCKDHQKLAERIGLGLSQQVFEVVGDKRSLVWESTLVWERSK